MIWDKVAEGYIEVCLNNEIDINNEITQTMHLKNSIEISSPKKIKNDYIEKQDISTKWVNFDCIKIRVHK